MKVWQFLERVDVGHFGFFRRDVAFLAFKTGRVVLAAQVAQKIASNRDDISALVRCAPIIMRLIAVG